MVGLVNGGAADAVGGDTMADCIIAGLKRIFGGAGCGKGKGDGGEGDNEEERAELHDVTMEDVCSQANMN